MLNDENRKAQVAFSVKLDLTADLDYRSLGYFVGRNAGSRIPALLGLPSTVSSDEVKHLGASAAAAGPATMIHIPGITPGSDTLADAAGGNDVEKIDVTRSHLAEVESDLNQTSEPPDLVAFGVPHLSAGELGQLAKMLEGRKLRKGVKMYAYTSAQAYDLAERTGIRSTIEESGARMTHSTDAEISPLKKLGFNVVMTNSAKLAEIVSSEGEIKVRYASQARIIEEVTS
jgi:predicted aconitase